MYSQLIVKVIVAFICLCLAPAAVASPRRIAEHATASEIKYRVHNQHSQTGETDESGSKGKESSGENAKSKDEALRDAETKEAKSASEETPEQAFEANRISSTRLKSLEAAVDKDRLTSRVLNAMKKDLIEFNSIKLKLVSKTVGKDQAVLKYVAEDPTKDLKITAILNREAGRWHVTSEDSSGTVSDEFFKRLLNEIPASFPKECAVIGIAAVLVGLGIIGTFVAGIWLIVVAFRVSLPWGLVTTFLPGGALLFAALNFGKSKWPVVTWLISYLIAASAIVGLVTFFGGELADLTKLQQINERKTEEI